MQEVAEDEEEPEYEGYTAQKFEIIKDSLARLSFFRFWYKGNFYHADALNKTIRLLVFDIKQEVVCTFKNYYDLMDSTFLDGIPFKKLVATEDLRITAF